MKISSVLIAAVLAGTATFVGQQELQASPRSSQLGPAQSRALGALGSPARPDGRRAIIARRSTAPVDQAVADLKRDLDLTPGQVARIKPILEADDSFSTMART